MKNNKLVVIGYSGHSFGCIEVAINQGFLVIGYYDISKKVINPYNLNYLGTQENIHSDYKPIITN